MTDVRDKYKPTGFLEAAPCLGPKATARFEELVTSKEVFEIGSGGSTLWLSQRVARLESLEDDKDWFDLVKVRLAEIGTIADTRLVVTPELHNSIIDMWDVIFVDPLINLSRGLCIQSAKEHVKPGGWLVADDAHFKAVAVELAALREDGWEVEVLKDRKIHPVKKVSVKTSCAFCRKPL